MGLDDTGRIGRVVVDPQDSDRVYVCALGRLSAPQQERGVYRTEDAGKTWQRVLFVDANTGCSGIGMDPENPRTLFAGMWQVEMHTWRKTAAARAVGCMFPTIAEPPGLTSRATDYPIRPSAKLTLPLLPPIQIVFMR